MKKAKIVLIDIVDDGRDIIEPLGIASIASVLRENGFETMLLAEHEKKIPHNDILNIKPSLVGVTVQKNTVRCVKKFTNWLKHALPETKIATGGYLATYYANEILSYCDDIDCVVMGEGEYTFLELANRMNTQKEWRTIDGITYRDDMGEIVANPRRELLQDLDRLPPPSRDIMMRKHLRLAQVEGSRGCSSACTFCSLHNFWTNEHTSVQPNWRSKSVRNFVSEIESLNKMQGIERYTLLDCSFENPNCNTARMTEIAKEIIFRELEISYYVNMRASSYKFMSDEQMELLVASGLTGVFLGVESFYEDDLKLFGKPATVRDNDNAIRYFSKFNVNLDIGLLMFHPYATLESLRENAFYLRNYQYTKKMLYMSDLIAYKGTQLYEKIKNDGLLVESEEFGDDFVFPQYAFVDPRVHELYKGISDYIAELGAISDKINYYANDHLDVVMHLLKKHRNTAGKEILVEYYAKYKEINAIYSEKTYHCFSALIELAENRFDAEQLKEKTKDMLSVIYLKKYLKEIEKNRMQLFYVLSQIDKNSIIGL